jgi:hypothetical protein
VVKSNQSKPFWNDEHRVQPHCIRRETVRSPFFWFRYRFVRSKIKVSILKYIRTEQNWFCWFTYQTIWEKIKVLQLLIYKNFNFYYKNFKPLQIYSYILCKFDS